MSALRRYHTEHLPRRSPTRPAGSDDEAGWGERIAVAEASRVGGTGLSLGALPSQGGEVVALCSLSNVVGGAFRAARRGFSLAAGRAGRRLTREAPKGCSITPSGRWPSTASWRTPVRRTSAAPPCLTRLGFARASLRIDGASRDHLIAARIADLP